MGGSPCGSRRHPTFPAVAPPVVPPLGLARRVLPLGTVVWFVSHSRSTASPPCRGVLGGGGGSLPATVIPHVPSPSPRCPRPFPWWVWELGWGGGGGPRCPSSGVSTSQARHWHVARHLSFCWGVGHAAWPPSSPFPLCVRSPGAPPAGACTALASLGHGRVVRPAPSPRRLPREGGSLSAPPFLHPPPLGGRRRVWGGGPCRLPFVAPMPLARGASPVPLQGGGACLAASVVALSTLRSHPWWSPRRGLHGACPLRAQLCGSSRTLLPLPPHPAALSSGGGSLFAPPLPAFPALGGAGVGRGGRGALVVFPLLHARRRHYVGTTQSRGEAIGCCGGGGVSLWAFPPFSMVQAPHSMFTSRCCPSAVVATSPHGAHCPVPAPSCAHTYWKRYVPGWKRKMRKCGQRGGLTVRLEGFLRHPPPWSRGGPLFRHPTARGEPTAHPLPGARVSTSERPDTGAVV